VGKTNKPDEEFNNITFELAINKKEIAPNMIFFGFLGSLKQDDALYPFVLLGDGQLDFGSSFEDDTDRYGQTNIRTRPIEIGALFSTKMTIGDPPRLRESTYQITQITHIS
jgi:hypothetical protein